MKTLKVRNKVKTKPKPKQINVNGKRYEKNGWICIDVHGSSYEIGYSIGYLLSDEIKKVFKTLEFIFMNTYGLSRVFFRETISELFRKQIKKHYPEYYTEMKGVADGIQ